MNVYYNNPLCINKLPFELINHIYTFLPPHPVKVLFEKMAENLRINLNDVESDEECGFYFICYYFGQYDKFIKKPYTLMCPDGPDDDPWRAVGIYTDYY